MKLKGRLFDVGDIDDVSKRGIRLECDGRIIEITGLTKDECREVAQSLGEFMDITVDSSALLSAGEWRV